MKFQISVTISYKDIFNDFEETDIKSLLKDIPTKMSLQIVGHFLAQLHTVERDAEMQSHFLWMWVGRLSKEVHKQIESTIIDILSKPNTEYNFLNNASSLILIEELLENHNNLDEIKDLSLDQELRLFKAYLYCSQLWTDKHINVFEGNKVTSPEELIKILLPVQIPYQEVIEIKDFRLQFIKAIYFFKFCESNSIFSSYLELFLLHYNLPSWKKYLFNLVELYTRFLSIKSKPSVLEVTNDFPEIKSFIDDFCLDINSFSKDKDFINLREKPIYRVSANSYLFLNYNFLVDKLFQGIQFIFSQVIINNGATYNGKKIKNYSDFKSIYGSEFSENGLFYSVMNHTFEKAGYITFTGNKLKEFINDGEPDYFVRDKSKIYLFEYKDVLINATTKHSYNYQEIVDEIFKKFVKNQNNSDKGVSQLINVIERIEHNELNEGVSIKPQDAIIYPIIVYTDFSINLSGINYLLNKKFRELLNERGVSLNVKDLILIDLNSFIKFQDLFREKKIKLNFCCNNYLESIQKGDYFQRISTFNVFLHNITQKMKYDTPKLFFEEIEPLMENQ